MTVFRSPIQPVFRKVLRGPFDSGLGSDLRAQVIEALFGDGTAGFLTLFNENWTDSAQTTVAVADDQIGATADDSGNGKVFVQPNSAEKPNYRVLGGLTSAEFIETDDALFLDTGNKLLLGSDASVFFAFDNGTQSGTGSIHKPLLSIDGPSDGYMDTASNYNFGLSRDGSDALRVVVGSGTAIEEVVHPFATDGNVYVAGFVKSGTSCTIYVDGASVATGTLSRTTGFTAESYALGANSGRPDRNYKGKIYGAVGASKALNASQIELVTQLLSEEAGKSFHVGETVVTQDGLTVTDESGSVVVL